MMTLHRLAFLAMLLVLPANAGAADLAPGVLAPQLYAQCPVPVYSAVPVLVEADPAAIFVDVQTRYAHAIEVSQRPDIIFSPSQAYTWAEATKLSCGKAIGYLQSHEINALQIHECDCFHRRMTALLQ